VRIYGFPMIAHPNFERAGPVAWLGSFPVYLAACLAAAHVVTMALTAVAMAVAGPSVGNPWLLPWIFSWETSALEGRLWQFVTYVFVNPPSIWVVIQIVLLAVFGTEIEKFLGRRQFLGLYAALVLSGPLLMCLLGLAGMGGVLSGGSSVHFGVFVAFVILYPRAPVFFGIEARWIAAALLGVYTLQGVASRSLLQVGTLWWICLTALVYLRWESVAALKPEPGPAKKRRPRQRTGQKTARGENLHSSIDPILEKISRKGISSLTRDERERLEKARSALIEKERKSH
jgi:membrane associated rhomboid family serine protease